MKVLVGAFYKENAKMHQYPYVNIEPHEHHLHVCSKCYLNQNFDCVFLCGGTLCAGQIVSEYHGYMEHGYRDTGRSGNNICASVSNE